MRSVRSDFRVAISALAVGIMAIAARPALADVTSVIIISPTENMQFSGSAGDDVNVEFEWSHSHPPLQIPETVDGFWATITIGPLDNPVVQESFFYDKDQLPLLPFVFSSETLTIPAGTAPACYDLQVKVEESNSGMLCCEKEDTEQEAVCIGGALPNGAIAVPVDIKPGSCPNPINTGKGGVIPVAIAGTGGSPVSAINPHSIRLMGVKPIRFNSEDVATPFHPFVGKEADCLECTTARGDGIMDLTLKFNAQEVVEAIRAFHGDADGELKDRECLVLVLTGERDDGTPIIGEDVVRIQDKGQRQKGGADKNKSKKSKPKKKK